MIDQTPIVETGIHALARADLHIGRVLRHRPVEADAPGPLFLLINEPDISESLLPICHSQALAYSCLFDNGKKRPSENERTYRLRQERVHRILNLCAGVNITNLRNRGVRNALEHFDERYLKSLINSPNSGRIIDISASHKDIFGAYNSLSPVYIRVYYFHEDELWLFDEHMKLIELRAEIEQVMSALGFKFVREP